MEDGENDENAGEEKRSPHIIFIFLKLFYEVLGCADGNFQSLRSTKVQKFIARSYNPTVTYRKNIDRTV